MDSKFNKREYDNKFNRENYMKLTTRLSLKNDTALIEHLNKQTNKNQYIKDLIIQDMNKNK